MNYYERHLGDYARDTTHLSLLEHGVYTLLLDRYYATEQGIPKDQVYRVTRASSRPERAAVDAVIGEFFVLTDGVYRNKRADQLIAEFHDAAPDREAKRENGKERVRRHRERRKALFDQLRELGVVPDFDTPTADLERHLKRATKQEVTQPVTRYDTAIHTPDPYPVSITPDTPPERTRDARTPAPAVELVGQFEGHAQPQPAPSNPAAVAIAVALNGAGFRCTTLNPDLVAYAAEGGFPDHVAQVAAQPDCAGKSATYVLRFARRELAQPAATIEPGAPRPIRGSAGDSSKTFSALHELEDLKSNGRTNEPPKHLPGDQQRRLADDRNRDRVAEAADALAGSLTRR